MAKKFDIFYFSSSHWDREWYQDFQGFRYRLVKMVDQLLELFERDKEYKTFHFDGQTVVLEDYVEISPEKKEQLKALIKERRILIGPWYVMPDEFLVSGESLIRNLMKGHEICRNWGQEAWKYGYVCDCFGHIAQMPQIFNGFSIKYSLLGRGMSEKDPAFFKWKSPDGSEVLSYNLEPNSGYGNFKQIVYENMKDPSPENPEMVERIKRYVDNEIERAELPIVIIMDGLDHAEASVHTTAYMRKIAELYPDATIHHKDLCEQGLMLEAAAESLPVVSGELNKTAQLQHKYLHLITNTLSSYYPIKQQNDKCQNLLEKQIEPLCALSVFDGIDLNRSFVKTAYKYLLQNHAHDSICGCAIDQVHKDVEYRFDQTEGICRVLREDYLYQRTTKRKTADNKDYENILTLYNMLPFDLDKTFTVELDFPQEYCAQYQEPFGYEKINSFRIFDSAGTELPYQVIDIKRGIIRRIHNELIETKDVHTVTFRASVPACGKAEFRIVPSETPVRYLEKIKAGTNYAENDFIRLDILQNGSIQMTDKKTGRIYSGLGTLENDGEIGDGWYHVNPVNDIMVTSAGDKCSIERIEYGPSRCVFRITRHMELPENMICDQFGKRRSERKVNVKITTLAGLSAESRYVDIKLDYDNTVRDHRMRLLLPTGIISNTYFSGQAFYCCERKVGIDYHTQTWSETEQYEKATNGIFGKRDAAGAGIAFVSAEGLHECAAYDDFDGTLSVTLSRSFKTTVKTNGETRCQINRPLSYSFALVPLDENVQYADLVRIQDIMALEPMLTFECVEKGTLPAAPLSKLRVGGKHVVGSIIKAPESGEQNAIVVRVFNTSPHKTEGFIDFFKEIVKVEITNFNEEAEGEIPAEKNRVNFELQPWKIATFKIHYRT